jgi:hypothetical protein
LSLDISDQEQPVVRLPFESEGASYAALQRIARTHYGYSYAYSLLKKSKMSYNWKIEFTDPDCKHDNCTCSMKLTGTGPKTMGMEWTGAGKMDDQIISALSWMENSRETFIKGPGVTEQKWLENQLRKDGSIKIVPPPFNHRVNWPSSVELPGVKYEISEMLKRVDYRRFQILDPTCFMSWAECNRYIWAWTPVKSQIGSIGCDTTVTYDGFNLVFEMPKLSHLCLRALSTWHWAVGKTNGRMHVTSAMADLDKKAAQAVCDMSRQPIGDQPVPAIKNLDDGLNLLYNYMGIDLSIKKKWKPSFSGFSSAYLGASSGLKNSKAFVIQTTVEDIKALGRGKKIDFIEQDLLRLLEFYKTGKEPFVAWTLPLKDENFFSWTKQLDDNAYAAWKQKARLYNVPDSVFMHAEKQATAITHYRERGKVIRIGSKWPRGGAWALAQCLGIGKDDGFVPCIVESDGKHFDQSVRPFFINIYWSTRLLHYDPTDELYPVLVRLIKYLCKNYVHRYTHLMGDLWGVVFGGVPSGSWETSHADSFIMALYLCLFFTHQMKQVPLSERGDVELYLLEVVRLVVFGDDNLYNRGVGPWSSIFSGANFVKFMKESFDVDIRDLRDGVPFCSKERGGWIVSPGCSFLKHYMVENPLREEVGQPPFLPYRETREFVARAVWSRTPKDRDLLDIILSIIGQAYSTYGSNKDAYDTLFIMYQECIRGLGYAPDLKEMVLARVSRDDLKKFRQCGIDEEDIARGFPSWSHLQERNVYDPKYHETSLLPGQDISDDDEFDYDITF